MRTTNSKKSPRLHYAWVVLTVGTFVVFGALGLARFGYTMLLPAMQAGLGLDNTQAGGRILGTGTYLIKFGASGAANGETRLKTSAFCTLKRSDEQSTSSSS